MLKNIPYGQDLEWDWTVLDYNGWPVRIFIINNIPWWALTDVCNLIGLDNASKTALRLDDNEKMALTLGNSRSGRRGGAQKLLIINEPGLYHLLLTSEKPEAKFFRRWVTAEVLPSIHRNGGYILGQNFMDADELNDASQQVAQNILAERDRQIAELLIQNRAQAMRLRELEPRAQYCDAVLCSSDAIPITLIAKDYGFSAQRLNKYLYEKGVQYPCGGTWVLYQRYAGKGYVHPETILYGTGRCKQYTRWTPKGRAFLYDFLKADGILPLSERMNPSANIDDFWLP